MKKIFTLAICLILFAVPMVSALVTDLNIDADVDETYIVRISNYQTGETIQRDVWSTNDDGAISRSFQTEMMALTIKIMSTNDNGKVEETKEFGPFPAGSPININFNTGETIEAPEVVPLTEENNTSENNSLEDLESDAEEEEDLLIPDTEEVGEDVDMEGDLAPVTGFSVSGYKTVFSKMKYYLIGIILIIGIMGLLFFAKHKLSNKKTHENNSPATIIGDGLLLDAEEKLKTAQKEIGRIKSIKEAEQKLEKDRLDLEELEKED